LDEVVVPLSSDTVIAIVVVMGAGAYVDAGVVVLED